MSKIVSLLLSYVALKCNHSVEGHIVQTNFTTEYSGGFLFKGMKGVKNNKAEGKW